MKFCPQNLLKWILRKDLAAVGISWINDKHQIEVDELIRNRCHIKQQCIPTQIRISKEWVGHNYWIRGKFVHSGHHVYSQKIINNKKNVVNCFWNIIVTKEIDFFFNIVIREKNLGVSLWFRRKKADHGISAL